MRTKFILVLLFAVLPISLRALQVYAATESVQPEEKPVGTPTTSTDGVKHHRFSLLLQPIGYGPSNTVSTGLTAGYRVASDWIVQLEYMRNLYNVTYDQVSKGRHQQSQGNSFGVHAKYFVFNLLEEFRPSSFYVKAGIDHRTFDYSATEGIGMSGFESNSTVLSIAVGNQWQGKYLTVGCDWFGYVIPLASSINGEFLTNGAQTDLQSRLNTQKDSVAKINLQALRFYIGASF